MISMLYHWFNRDWPTSRMMLHLALRNCDVDVVGIAHFGLTLKCSKTCCMNFVMV
jgi:hypothetical protein